MALISTLKLTRTLTSDLDQYPALGLNLELQTFDPQLYGNSDSYLTVYFYLDRVTLNRT